MTDKPTRTEKLRCPSCGPSINCDVMAETQYTVDDGEFWNHTNHSINKCRGCDKVFHVIRDLFSENVYQIGYGHDGEPEYEEDYTYKYWPDIPKRTEPAWFSSLKKPELEQILHEVYSGFDQDLLILTSAGIRTAFDKGTEIVGADPATTFDEKLDYLVDSDLITKSERDRLGILVESGNASNHRGWKPKKGQVDTLLDILESFIQNAILPKPDTSGFKIPPKPKRKKKAVKAVKKAP